MFIKRLRGKQLFCSTSRTCKTLRRATNFSTVKDILMNCKENISKQDCVSLDISNPDAKSCTNVEHDFKNELIKWAIQNNISHIAFSRLLKLLVQNKIKDLPESSKILLKAKENEIVVSLVPPGTYTHFGFKKNLQIVIQNLVDKNLITERNINISIFIDQLPLVKLTRKSLWVILGSVESFINSIFIIGVYQGFSKPNDSNLFLSRFVKEAKELCAEGLEVNNVNYFVKIKRLISDAPAKAFVLNFNEFNGYSSCTKCNTVGIYKNNKICFLEKGSQRKDEDFEKEEMYQNAKTNLLEIPNFGIVSNVTLDYMHLVCLGVVHKLLKIWLRNKKCWICEESALNLSRSLAPVYPCEFSKQPRSLTIHQHWNASDFQQFLLYYGPVILKDSLKQEYYDHFLLLHVACRLLCTEASPKNIDFSRTLLNDFVENYKKLYKSEQITHNFHGLYHLADECAAHGTLDSFSAFPFEKFLCTLKRAFKKSKKVSFPQIILQESWNKIFSKSLSQLSARKDCALGKLKSENYQFQNCSHFEKLVLRTNFSIVPHSEGDKFVLLKNGKIIQVTNILKKKENSKITLFVAGKEFFSVTNFHSVPFDSLDLNMYKVQQTSDSVELWPVDFINKKFMKIPIRDEESVMVGLLDHNF